MTYHKLFLIWFVVIQTLVGFVLGTTYTVDDDGHGNFVRIQDAIDHSAPHDTILVFSGYYPEHVIVNKSDLTLRGFSLAPTIQNSVETAYGYPIIDGEGAGTVLTIVSANTIVEGFVVQESGLGYYDAGIKVLSNNNILRHLTVFNNSQGIIIQQSAQNNVKNIQILGGNFHGILLMSNASNNTISSNYFHDNLAGILIYNSCQNNLINTNIFDWNRHEGIRILYTYPPSNANTIYHNMFLHNNAGQISQCYDENVNSWDLGLLGGNYWSDYTGTDENGDGFGDVPYTISGGNNRDNYPLLVSLIARY
ncbi:MAG: NosD domain-containing protein [Nanoarchaeota archaeon]